MNVDSFAAGVSSPALKAMLADAEELLATGRYADAVARYEAAGQLVPNQPLVLLGRGTSELAAGFYRRSAGTLRGAITNYPELAMARVNVVDMIGGERTDTLAEDLRQLAEEQPQSDVPVFLLAYLSYAGGDFDRADGLLVVAEERSGDPFYAAVRRLWLPGTAGDAPATRPATDLQK